MKYLVFLVLLSCSLTTEAQRSYPIFATKEDSVGYAKVNEAIMNIFKSEQTTSSAKKLDSLNKLRMNYVQKIVGQKYIYEQNKKFTSIEDLVNGKANPDSIKQLSISSSYAKIPSRVFSCKNLKEIEFINSKIKKIPNKLNKLNQLSSLYFYNYKGKSSLKSAKNKVVKELLITGTESNKLPKSFKNFRSLEHLNLNNNINLKSFPNIYENKKLKKLNLYMNQLTLDDLKSGLVVPLEELNLQQNKIRTVPENIGTFKTLKKITFNYNQINEVTLKIGDLKNLEEISFYNNKLTSIPSGIYNLSQLKSIDLYHNEISKIESNLNNLTSLEILYLSNNQLTTLPDNLGQLKSLRELYISNNKLFTLPTSLNELNKLTVFRANKNKLSDFPEFVFTLPLVENIDISSNDIRSIPYSITELPKLAIFVMSDNPILKEDSTIEKLVLDLRKKGVVVHQNYFSEQKLEDRTSENQN